jgi:hypothetical protein
MDQTESLFLAPYPGSLLVLVGLFVYAPTGRQATGRPQVDENPDAEDKARYNRGEK